MELKRFNNFSEDRLLESVINESIIYYSTDLRKIFTKMKDNSIAQNLLEIEATDIKPDITFVDLGKEGYLGFSTMRNAKKVITDKFPHLDYIDNKVDKEMADELFHLDKVGSSRATGVTTKSRNEVSLGKFVNKILPGKYSDKDRESFVNLFKATIEKTGEHFEIIEGEEIGKWYHKQTYKEVTGNLGNSCMSEKPDSYFQLYIQNPEVCKMVILLEDDKLLGRALVWKLNTFGTSKENLERFQWFMDRQYTITDSDVQKFINFAKEKGWSWKTYNNHHSYRDISFGEEKMRGSMTVKVKPKEYAKYPYVDTFRRYDPERGLLHNDDNVDNSDYEGQLILADTLGGFERIQAGKYSEFYDRMIPEERAVWSDIVDSYLDSENDIHVGRGSRRRWGWYPDGDDNVVYDDWNGQYIHVDDSVYSEYYGYSLLTDEAVEVVTDISSTCEIEGTSWMHNDDDKVLLIKSNTVWHERMMEKERGWKDYEHILKKICEVDNTNNLVPEVLLREVYKLSNPIEGVQRYDFTDEDIYLLEEDANILGWTVDKDDYIKIDIFTYYQETEEFHSAIKRNLRAEIQKISDQLEGKGQLYIKSEDDDIYRKKLQSKLRYLVAREEDIEWIES
jgi:hypothetical protein